MFGSVAEAGATEDETCRTYVLPMLQASGWGTGVVEQYRLTDGRIVPLKNGYRRAQGLRADYVLEYSPGVPVAVVEAKREHAIAAKGMQQGRRYGGLLDVPTVYATNGHGIVEFDQVTGVERDVDKFASPTELWQRYQTWKGLSSDAGPAAQLPFDRSLTTPDGRIKTPRYYQRVAVQRVVEAALGGNKRILLTMATGTGKTFTAMQIVSRLWRSQWCAPRRPRVLYLADRKILIDHPLDREFRPVFGDATWRLQGTANYSREIYFALYQSLMSAGASEDLFSKFAPDFFDLIIVDECHRGSASGGSSWRAILEHFTTATQVGLTATPLRDANRDTYSYFGSPVYEYSLAQGIDDGFLAPYSVRRVVLSPDAAGWAPPPGTMDRFGREVPDGLYETKDFERVVSLLARTEAAARHLAARMRATGRYGKSIVFCVDSEHADQMRRALANENADITSEHPDYVVRIVSDEGDVGRDHLDRLIDDDTDYPVIATTSQMLSTGVDIPTLRNVVIFKPIASMVDFKQIIGRGTRLSLDNGKSEFEIIDYSGATALFRDPAFDGPAERVVTEEVDDDGEIISEEEEEQEERELTDDASDDETTSEDDSVPERQHRKLYVDDGAFTVHAESEWGLDPETGRLRLKAHRELVRGELRELFSDPGRLLEQWRSAAGRLEIKERLEEHGVDVAGLLKELNMDHTDVVDALLHVTWDLPVITRHERARRLRRKHASFLMQYQEDARSVLDDLLDKYIDEGVGQLEDLAVLSVPPLTRHGTAVQIAAKFGGAPQLRRAVAELEALLYDAA
jgi:type I restriction enzyme R subunit